LIDLDCARAIIFKINIIGEFMFKRIGIFILTNILVIATISILMSVFGIRGYLTTSGIDYSSLLFICAIWGFAGSFISLLLSKFMAKMAYRMQPIAETDHQIGYVATAVKQYAQVAGLQKSPEVYIYDSPEVNAFATGASRNNSLVAVSTGLLQKMDRNEVEGVLAHEVSHIANGDMVTMALAQGVVNAFVMFLSRVAAFAIDQAMRGDDEEGGGLGTFAYMMLVWVLDIAFSILAAPLLMWFSRYREYRADAGGARLAGREKMIAALQRLANQHEALDNREPNLAAFKISGKSRMIELFASHPSLEKRIQALRGA
jgi:heat shock protein HtpX